MSPDSRMQSDADKMLGPWGSNKHAGFEGLGLVQEVDTGNVRSREVSEAQEWGLQGWQKSGVAGLCSRMFQHGTCRQRWTCGNKESEAM